jgi:hypothetical protein
MESTPHLDNQDENVNVGKHILDAKMKRDRRPATVL